MRNLLIGVVSLSMLLVSCIQKPLDYYTLKGEVHGTYYSIKYGATSEKVSVESLDSLFFHFDRSLSTFDSLSVISKVNQNDSTVILDSLFLKVYNKGMEVSQLTDGAFDMTVAPLVNCWGFGFKKKENVTPIMIDSILAFVGYQKVSLSEGKIIKQDSRMMLDASAIAKGYSCDVVADYLNQLGIENYMVEIGGEIVVKGHNPENKDWNIGITKPMEDNTLQDPTLQDIIHLTDCGMATSGNYRQFYYKDGKRYSHTINPHTGYPAERSLLSTTVVSDDCMTSDAFATAFMVMGIDSAYAYASDHSMSAYFIYVDDSNQLQVRYTDSFKKYMNQ